MVEDRYLDAVEYMINQLKGTQYEGMLSDVIDTFVNFCRSEFDNAERAIREGKPYTPVPYMQLASEALYEWDV